MWVARHRSRATFGFHPAPGHSVGVDGVSAYLGLGSNLGDRLARIEEACARLRATTRISALECSPVYETAPVGGPAQACFLNAVARIETTLAPRALLVACLAIEQDMGRVREARNGPRTIDLDVLLYADRVVAEPQLTIPHPRLCERRFVLAPLADLAADLRPPNAQHTVRQLLALLPPSDAWVRRFPR